MKSANERKGKIYHYCITKSPSHTATGFAEVLSTKSLSINNYDSATHNLKISLYAANVYQAYTYDNLDRVKTVRYNNVGVVSQALGSAAISMVNNAAQQIDDVVAKKKKFNVPDMLFDGVVGFACGRLGGSGATYGNTSGIRAVGNQYAKRGLLNSKAATYFVKNAHNQGGKFVFSSLGKSLGISAVGTAIGIGKTHATSFIRRIIR